MAATCLMSRRPELMLWGVGEVFMVPMCALKDPLRCTQTPLVISVLGAAQGHLALERGRIWLHVSSVFPAQQGSGARACPGSRMLSSCCCRQQSLPATHSSSLGALLRPEASLVHSLTVVTACFPRAGDVVSSMAQQEPLAFRSF